MTRASDDNTPPDAPHAPGTDADPHRGEASEERADSLREPQSYGEAAAWKLVQEVRWQRDEWKAECERLQRELSEAREAVGEGWFAGGATLAQAIRRKVHVLECERENRRADEHPPAPVDGPRSEHQHTGATAFWCGICGDCVCPRDSNGECHFDNEKCPLHRAGSAHVEGPEGGAR